jgi:Holliday junction resolvase RusA-like endonuclease
VSTARAICSWCGDDFIPSVNRPDWPKCPTCTFTPSERKRGAAPGYALPAPSAQRLTFVVPGSPLSVNRVYRMGFSPKGHRIMFYSAEGKRWKAAVACHALARRPRDWRTDAQYAVTFAAYFQRTSADVDNLVKPALDALQGTLWANDRQVTSVTATKALDAEAPRLVVTVEVLPS